MTTENILYTDGHDVTVTTAILQVKKNRYRLEGIMNHAFHVIKPNRMPVITIFILGVMAISLGILNFTLPVSYTLQVYSYSLSANNLILLGGVALIVISALITMLLKKRYSVRIATAEGDKDVVVSERREYVTLIVEALDQANESMRQLRAGY